MKKVFPKIMSIIAALAVIVLVIGLLLPSAYQIERHVVINADPEQIHVYVNDLSKWPEWGPWREEDPTIVTTIGAKSIGIGAHQSWTGDSGSGELTFTASDPATGIEYDLSFDNGQFRSQAAMRYTLAGDGTRVTWLMKGDMQGNILGRYFALGMDGMAGPMFERGLEKLKIAVENLK